MRIRDFYNDEVLKSKKLEYDKGRYYGFRSDYSWIDETLGEIKGTTTIIDELAKHFRKNEEEKQNKMIIQNAKVIIDGKTYKVQDMRITHEVGTYPTAELSVSLNPLNLLPSGVIIHEVGGPVPLPKPKTSIKPIKNKFDIPGIAKVIFSYPATIVFWTDGTKTIVKCKPGDQWDPHAGISAAISKKFFGNQVSKWVKKAEYAKNPPVEDKCENDDK